MSAFYTQNGKNKSFSVDFSFNKLLKSFKKAFQKL